MKTVLPSWVGNLALIGWAAAELQRRLLVQNPMRLYWPEELQPDSPDR